MKHQANTIWVAAEKWNGFLQYCHMQKTFFRSQIHDCHGYGQKCGWHTFSVPEPDKIIGPQDFLIIVVGKSRRFRICNEIYHSSGLANCTYKLQLELAEEQCFCFSWRMNFVNTFLNLYRLFKIHEMFLKSAEMAYMIHKIRSQVFLIYNEHLRVSLWKCLLSCTICRLKVFRHADYSICPIVCTFLEVPIEERCHCCGTMCVIVFLLSLRMLTISDADCIPCTFRCLNDSKLACGTIEKKSMPNTWNT